MTPDLLDELAVLVQASLDRTITPEQFTRLETLLKADAQAREHYFELLLTQVALQGGQAAPVAAPKRLRLWGWVASAAALILVVLGLSWWRLGGDEPAWARVEAQVDAVWSEDAPMDLVPGHDYHLDKGSVKIAWADQVWTILEGPADFNIAGPNQILMTQGKLFAHVPPAGQGFTVVHPGGRVIDRGTEFGVLVLPEQETFVQVYQGRVDWIDDQGHNEPLVEQRAMTMNTQGRRWTQSFDPQGFVRQINERHHLCWQGESLDLADMVGGGFGLGSGSLNFGFDVTTGHMVEVENFTAMDGPRGYQPIDSHPFIDGLFVPGAQRKGCDISSTSLSWDACPVTTGRTWGGAAYNGAWFADQSLGVPRHDWSLGGRAYGRRRSSALSLHSNLGITFDLDAVRDLIDGIEIKAFHSRVGISETFFSYYRRSSQLLGDGMPHAAVTVLVDGVARFTCDDLTPQDRAVEILVNLEPEDRFLTLVSTEGRDNRIDFDWVLFTEPVLMTSRPEYEPRDRDVPPSGGSMESYWREYKRW